MRGDLSFRRTALTVVVFAWAMAYLEAAVVVYLEGALGSHVGDIFPLRPANELGNLIAIEAGREAATLVIIAAVGILVGRSRLELRTFTENISFLLVQIRGLGSRLFRLHRTFARFSNERIPLPPEIRLP